MTDKEKLEAIKAEIEIVVNRRLNLLNGDYFDLNKEANGFTNEIMSIINSMQEEPKKCMFTKDSYTDEDRKVLCEDCKEKCEYSKKEEPVSEDLEETINSYIENNFHGSQTLGFFSNRTKEEPNDEDIALTFKAGAEWQKEKDQETIETAIHHAYHNGRFEMKEQMMKNAIDAKIGSFTNSTIYDADFNIDSNLKDNDKVKIIIIKED